MARETGIVRKLRVDGQALKTSHSTVPYQITQREQANHRWGTMLRRQRPLYRRRDKAPCLLGFHLYSDRGCGE
jgi:hypothetical protein